MRHQLEAAAKFLEKEDALLQQKGRSGAELMSNFCTADTASERLGLTDSNPSECLLGLERRPGTGSVLDGSPDIDDELRAMGQAADDFHSLLASVPTSPLREDAGALGSHLLASPQKIKDEQGSCHQNSKQKQSMSGFPDENAGAAVSERRALAPLRPVF